MLRQMRANKCDTLIIGNYTGSRATFDQVCAIFGTADIEVCTVAAIEAAEKSSQSPSGK